MTSVECSNHERSRLKKPAKYADSSISDKAFKNMIIWFAIYCGLFCIGVIFFVGADQNYLLQ
ncbi:hypothetical protein LZ086_04735 [Acinetobacter johnsonii]|uniref:hypothetical protein n=1 Tax=Acinetobacter johnsonii TaxID=40214 RepID=UPI00220ECF9A|nr:hypothetical protein LZ086_04735 [Acinetobacter johnsonii]